MKNEPTQSKETQRPQTLPVIKLLGLATAAAGVLYHGWIDMMGGGWLIWLVLVLLMLLEAGAAESRAVAWSQAQAMVGRLLGPAMLPFYGALCLLLAVGPSYMRQAPIFALPAKGSSFVDVSGSTRSPNKPGNLNGGAPIPSSPPRPISSYGTPPRPAAMPVPTTASKPATTLPQVTKSGVPSATAAPAPASASPKQPASPMPAAVPATPSGMKTPAVFQRPPSIQPSGSARPAPAASPATSPVSAPAVPK